MNYDPGWDRILPAPMPMPTPADGVSEVGVSIPCEAVESTLSSPIRSSCRCMEGFMIRGWEPILPERG